jgi:hypothetical protein
MVIIYTLIYKHDYPFCIFKNSERKHNEAMERSSGNNTNWLDSLT